MDPGTRAAAPGSGQGPVSVQGSAEGWGRHSAGITRGRLVRRYLNGRHCHIDDRIPSEELLLFGKAQQQGERLYGPHGSNSEGSCGWSALKRSASWDDRPMLVKTNGRFLSTNSAKILTKSLSNEVLARSDHTRSERYARPTPNSDIALARHGSGKRTFASRSSSARVMP